MDFSISDKQKELRDLVRDIADHEISPRAIEMDRKGGIDDDLMKILTSSGMTSLAVPAEYGGPGLDMVTLSILYEELGRGCAGVATVCAANALASYPVLLSGSEKQKKELLGAIMEGQLTAFALTEPGAGSDAGAVSGHAQKTEGGYILNGTKCFITNGPIADKIVLFANTRKSGGIRGLTVFIVDASTEGFSVGKEEDKMGIRASLTSELIFHDCFIPESARIGREGSGFRIAMETLDTSRPVVGAVSVGIAQAALEGAVKYSHQRKQFGAKIASFQMVQQMVADMVMKTEAARALVQKACWLRQTGSKDAGMFAAMAKCAASDAAMDVSMTAVQVMGGNGYSRENQNEKYMRDAKVMQIYEGTNQIQRMVVANGVRY